MYFHGLALPKQQCRCYKSQLTSTGVNRAFASSDFIMRCRQREVVLFGNLIN
jgi:hypothetical protein